MEGLHVISHVNLHIWINNANDSFVLVGGPQMCKNPGVLLYLCHRRCYSDLIGVHGNGSGWLLGDCHRKSHRVHPTFTVQNLSSKKRLTGDHYCNCRTLTSPANENPRLHLNLTWFDTEIQSRIFCHVLLQLKCTGWLTQDACFRR